jgi:hypothetical protein
VEAAAVMVIVIAAAADVAILMTPVVDVDAVNTLIKNISTKTRDNYSGFFISYLICNKYRKGIYPLFIHSYSLYFYALSAYYEQRCRFLIAY